MSRTAASARSAALPAHSFIVLVLVIDFAIPLDFSHFDYDYEHEHRFAEHENAIAGQSRLCA